MSRRPSPTPPPRPPSPPAQQLLGVLAERERIAAEECRRAAGAVRSRYVAEQDPAFALATVFDQMAAANDERAAAWSDLISTIDALPEGRGDVSQAERQKPLVRLPDELSPTLVAEERLERAAGRADFPAEADVKILIERVEASQALLASAISSAGGLTYEARPRSAYASALRAIAGALEEARRVAGLPPAVWPDIPG